MPDNEKAEKINVESITWNSTSQAFNVNMSCKFGIATAGTHAGFVTSADLKITADGTLYKASGTADVAKVDGAVKDPNTGMIPIDPVVIPWDTGGTNITGDVDVVASVQINTKGGAAIGGVETYQSKVSVVPDPTQS